MLLPQIGEAGQQRLRSSHALLVGCGALGTVIADALVRAGVGRLTIADRDVVELTNLQRQVLFDESDVRDANPKAEAAAVRLRSINSQVEVNPEVTDVTSRTIDRLTQGVSVVLDGTDNFQTRYLLNDICVRSGLPLIYGGAVGTVGMTMSILPNTTPCLRCVFPEPPPPGSTATCDTAGVLGPAVGVIANMQAAEAIKILTGRPEACSRTLREIDLWSARSRDLDISATGPSPNCPCCGQRRFEFLEQGASDGTTALCGADAIQVAPPAGASVSVDLAAAAARLARHGTFAATRHLVRGTFTHESNRTTGAPIELTLFRDGRAVIKGTQDAAAARSMYAKYIGG